VGCSKGAVETEPQERSLRKNSSQARRQNKRNAGNNRKGSKEKMGGALPLIIFNSSGPTGNQESDHISRGYEINRRKSQRLELSRDSEDRGKQLSSKKCFTGVRKKSGVNRGVADTRLTVAFTKKGGSKACQLKGSSRQGS